VKTSVGWVLETRIDPLDGYQRFIIMVFKNQIPISQRLFDFFMTLGNQKKKKKTFWTLCIGFKEKIVATMQKFTHKLKYKLI
jgi:predicted P-loop ATPase